jgi:hypothetical protein
MDVGPDFRTSDLRFVFDEDFLWTLLEFDVFWLGSATGIAELIWTEVDRFTTRASPLQMHVTESLSHHVCISPLLEMIP